LLVGVNASTFVLAFYEVSFFGILILNVEAIVRLFKEVFAMW
jgi:hypothetical protein